MARLRVERADERARGVQRALVARHGVLQPRPLAVAEELQVPAAHDVERAGAPRGVRVHGEKLELEAFLECARGHARRIEALHQAQRGEEIFRTHVVLLGVPAPQARRRRA
jgi:hypothetical protein